MQWFSNVSLRRSLLLAAAVALTGFRAAPAPTRLQQFAVRDDQGRVIQQFHQPATAESTQKLLRHIEAARKFHARQSPAFYAAQWEMEVAAFYRLADRGRDADAADHAELPRPEDRAVAPAAYEISARPAHAAALAPQGAARSSASSATALASPPPGQLTTGRIAAGENARADAAGGAAWEAYWQRREEAARRQLEQLRRVPESVTLLRRIEPLGTRTAGHSPIVIMLLVGLAGVAFVIGRKLFASPPVAIEYRGAWQLEVPADWISPAYGPPASLGRAMRRSVAEGILLVVIAVAIFG
jgi:hypothetical protein